MDCFRNSRNLYPDSGCEWFASRTATRRGPWPGCEITSHCCAASENARSCLDQQPRDYSIGEGNLVNIALLNWAKKLREFIIGWANRAQATIFHSDFEPSEA